MEVKNPIIYLLLTLVFSTSVFVGYAQRTDTIKIEIENTIYDTITVFDAVYTHDTIFVNRFFDGIDISPSYSLFNLTWRNYSGNIRSSVDQKNFSAGAELSLVKGNFSLSTGFFYSQISATSDFNRSDTYIDSIPVTEIITNSYFNLDTISSEWQIFTQDSIIDDTTTIVITDSTFVFITDSTEVFYNDTITKLIGETVNVDTTYRVEEKMIYYDIPIIFRYRIYNAPRFNLHAGTGVILGILRQSTLYYQTSLNDYPRLVGVEQKLKLFPSIWLSAKSSYFPHHRVAIFCEPYYILGVRSIFTKDSDISGIPDRYGVRLGISVIL